MRVLVNDHAVDAYRRRRANQRGVRAVREDISEMVEKVISEGRLLNHRPSGFSLYGRGKRQSVLPVGQWFAPCGDIGFIVKKDSKTRWAVITMLTRTGS